LLQKQQDNLKNNLKKNQAPQNYLSNNLQKLRKRRTC